MKSKHPKKAEKLKAHLNPTTRAKLIKIEEEYDVTERKKKLATASKSFHDTDEIVCEVLTGNDTVYSPGLLPGVVSLQALVRGSISRKSIVIQSSKREEEISSASKAPASATGSGPFTSAASSLFRKVTVESESSGAKHVVAVPPVKTVVPQSQPKIPEQTYQTTRYTIAMICVFPVDQLFYC